MKLHLGCGNKHLDGFLNVDIRKMDGVDLVDDITKLSSIENNSADIIYISHVLEHVGRREYMDVLKRWYDILKPGGVLRIAVPDFEQVVKHYNQHGDLRILLGFLYGGQNYPQNYHYCTWDFKTLSEDLVAAGFGNVRRYDWKKTEHASVDDFSQCYLPHMDKDNGMLMSLNVEAVKVKPIDKQELIELLKKKQTEVDMRVVGGWQMQFGDLNENSWEWYGPMMSGLIPKLIIKDDGKVIIKQINEYIKDIQFIELTYEEFADRFGLR